MKKNNLSLIFGLSIPLLMILFVGLSVYLPRLLAPPPQYDFLYYISDSFYATDSPESRYIVKKGTIEFIDNNPSENFEDISMIFRHDVSENKSYEITYDEAKLLELIPSYESPDGYELVNSWGNDIMYFDMGYDELFIKGHGVNTEMDFYGTNIYYSQLNFLAWINE